MNQFDDDQWSKCLSVNHCRKVHDICSLFTFRITRGMGATAHPSVFAICPHNTREMGMVMQCEEPQHLDSCCSRLLQHNSINSIIYKAKVGFILWLDLVFGASRFSFTCSSTNYFREYPAAKCQDSPSGPWGHCWSAYSGMRACIASLACSKPPCTESHTRQEWIII